MALTKAQLKVLHRMAAGETLAEQRPAFGKYFGFYFREASEHVNNNTAESLVRRGLIEKHKFIRHSSADAYRLTEAGETEALAANASADG